MNVLFVTSAAPAKSPFSTSEKRPPLGVGSLLALARNEGHRIFFIDNYLKPMRFLEAQFLQENRIDLVGIHANTVCFRDTAGMINRIEDLRRCGDWGGKVVVGGPHCSVLPETIPEYVDHVVIGEGEVVVSRILKGEALPRLLPGERLNTLDALPFQPWDIFSKMPYDQTCLWMRDRPVFTMNTSRGCPFDCSFCSVHSVWGRLYTFFSAERTMAEMEYLMKEYQAKGVYFREDNFTLNEKRTRELCEGLLKKGMALSWACETRVDNLSEDLLRLMAASGCRGIYLGIESGSQAVLDLLKKEITVDQIENVMRWAKKYRIKTYVSLITGVPGETYRDYLLTKKLLRRIRPDFYSFNVYVGIPGSCLYRSILENNSFEYQDDLGLLYLPGFDVKVSFFYGLDSRELVDHEFSGRTPFDRELEKKVDRRRIRRRIKQTVKRLLGRKKS